MNDKLEKKQIILSLSLQSGVMLLALILVLVGLAFLLGPGWSVLVAFAVMPIVITRWLVEEQRVIVMRELVKRLQQKSR